jgi:hypothetical protein
VKPQWYVMREYDDDEGYIAQLTEVEYKQIQERLDIMAAGDVPPFWIYPMEVNTFEGLNKFLDEYVEEMDDEESPIGSTVAGPGE